LIEGAYLVARNESDGKVTWMASVSGPGVQAPVVASGKVIVATAAGIVAFHATDGSPAWPNPAPVQAITSASSIDFTGGCAGVLQGGGPTTTTMAAALGSNLLVVTGSDGLLHLLSLDTGMSIWSGPAPGAVGPISNPVLLGARLYLVDTTALLALQSS
jgi:outer membrane protein assembly factor BamB